MTASEANLGGLPIAAGDVLLKKYRVERLIGEGGTGIVLSATHIQLERRVAIKFLRQALADDELRMRFEREARAIGKIESDHVVVVLDAGLLDDGSPYMVMEYLDGRDLARVVKEDGPLPVEEAVDCMLQVCEALGEAHDCGIVHRDLKPANLLLTRQEDGHVHVKVVDFGISKILDKTIVEGDGRPHEVTTAFSALGSPRWMAPEQIRNSKDVDGRADLWSVGAVLFQLISGKHAFDVEGTVQTSIAVLTGEPRKLADVVPGIAPELDAVVGKCLTKDVSERFQSAAELADALRPFASDRTKDSLDRLQNAKRAPSVRISVKISPMSRPPAALSDDVLLSGVRDAPTERRLRAAGAPPCSPAPSSVPALLPQAAGGVATAGASKLMLGALAGGALFMVFVGVVVFGLGLRSARGTRARGELEVRSLSNHSNNDSASPSPSQVRFGAERSVSAPSASNEPDAGR